MTPGRIIFLCCLPALCIADAGADEALIVGPGEALALEAPEAGTRLEAALDGGPLKPLQGDITAPATGDHWLAVAGRDGAGNLSPIRWIRLRVDSRPPHVALDTEPAPLDGGRLWMPPRATVTATAGDDLAGVAHLALAVDDAMSRWPPSGGTFRRPPSGEATKIAEHRLSAELPPAGEVVARAWAIDDAGNRSAEVTLALAIDSVPPSGEIRVGCSPAPGVAAIVVPPACRVDVEVLDHESGGVTWSPRIDGADAAPESLGGPWSAGSHTITVAARDAVGNEARIGPLTFTTDATGPEINWRVTSAGAQSAQGETFYRPPVAVTVEAEDSLAGLAGLLSSTDGTGYAPFDGTLDVAGDRLLLRAVDGVGNTSETEASWRLDVAPPEIHLETEDGEAIPSGATLELERGAAVLLSTTDHGAGVETSTYSMNVESADIHRRWWWNPPHDKPLPKRLVFPWPGELSLSIEAVDRLGNRQMAQWHVVVRRPAKGGS